jgi:remodeling and spacing factor 1
LGNCYWYHCDQQANLRVYKEDPDEETWEVVARTKEELSELINQLKAGNTYVRRKEKKSVEGDGGQRDLEDEESMQGYDNILRDTGPVPPSSEDPSAVTSLANSDDESSSNGHAKLMGPPASVATASKVGGEAQVQAEAQAEESTVSRPEQPKAEAPKDTIEAKANDNAIAKADEPTDLKGPPSIAEAKPVNIKDEDQHDAKAEESHADPETKKEQPENLPKHEAEVTGGKTHEAEDRAKNADTSKPEPLKDVNDAEGTDEPPAKSNTSFSIAGLVAPKKPKEEEQTNVANPEVDTPENKTQEEPRTSPSKDALSGVAKAEANSAAAKEDGALSPTKHSIERLISNEASDGKEVNTEGAKRSLEESGLSQDDPHNQAKKPKTEERPGEAIVEPTMVVEGRGAGADNQAVPNYGDVIEEPVMLVFGRGSGAECDARNAQVADDGEDEEGANGLDAGKSAVANLNSKKGLSDASGRSKESLKRSRKRKTSDDGQANGDGSEEDAEEDDDDDDDTNGKREPPKAKRGRKKGSSKKHKSMSKEDEETMAEVYRASRRSSGRIAALRVREAERRQREEEAELERYKEEQKRKAEREKRRMEKYRKLGLDYEKEMARKEAKRAEKRQTKYRSDSDFKEDGEDGDDQDEEEEGGKKRRRRRRKKKKRKKGEEGLREFERFSSGSSSGDEGLEGEEEDFEEDHEEEDVDLFKSDHEFSCESDDPEGTAQPIKHARTATKRKKAKKKAELAVESSEEEDEEEDEFACKKCNKSDHPEWILLCDKCDVGWHASCLRPPLMVVPEGDWFCPDCQHVQLLERLAEQMTEFEGLLAKKEADRQNADSLRRQQRRERLAFVSLSLSNMLPESGGGSGSRQQGGRRPPAGRRRRRLRSDSSSDDSDEGSSSGSDSSSSSSSSEDDEQEAGGNGLYPSRRRATRNISYTMKEYDDMIKSAIADGVEEVKGSESAGYGKNINTIVQGAAANEEEEEEEDEDESDTCPASRRGLPSGSGMGKDISTIIAAEKEEEEEEKEKAKADTVGPSEQASEGDGADAANQPAPMLMNIQKDIGKTSKKDKKKRKKLSDLTDSNESGDGDSGSDFHASEDEEPEEDEDFEMEGEVDEDDDDDFSDEGAAGRKKKGKSRSFPAPTRRSNRERKVLYDDDFVIDGSGSDEEEAEEEEDLSDAGWGSSKKRKKGKNGKKSRKSSSRRVDRYEEESEDSDFEIKTSKKKKKQLADLAADRRTRGRKIDYDRWKEDSEDSLEEEERQRRESASSKKRKRKDETSEEEFDEDLLQDKSEEEDDDDFLDDD